MDLLTSQLFIGFYTYGVDVVSILTVLAGAFRPLIYLGMYLFHNFKISHFLACMPQVRKDIIQQLHRCAGRNRYKPVIFDRTIFLNNCLCLGPAERRGEVWHKQRVDSNQRASTQISEFLLSDFNRLKHNRRDGKS